MRRFVLSLCAIVATLFSADAQITASEWLAQLRATLGSSYAWNIAVETQGGSYAGYYMVEGDAYYLTLGVMEVYSDGKLRYEINNARKEVTEDRVNLKAVDLLTNPTRAFNFVDSEYTITIKERTALGVVLKLVPKDANIDLSEISLELQKRGSAVLPIKLKYSYDDDNITIALTQLGVADKRFPRWNKESYRGYDIVSFL